MSIVKELYLLGVSFRTAPVAVREALSYTASEATALLAEVSNADPGIEALILSTCNRTEFYLSGAADRPVVEDWFKLLRQARPEAPILDDACFRYQLKGGEAARHLFEVSCGLDSSILGDVQILGQVKDAFATAARAGTLGEMLNRSLTQAIRAGKRARAETLIGFGAASVGSALSGMIHEHWAEQRAGRLPNFVLLGAGQAARDIGRHLMKRCAGSITHVNRTYEKAQTVARHTGGQSVPWNELKSSLIGADVVIAATSASEPVLTQDLLAQVAAARPHQPLLVVDTCSPRNIERGDRIDVVDIDSIEERRSAVLERRREAIPLVEAIVRQELSNWDRRRAAEPLEEEIKNLYLDVSAMSREMAESLLTADAPLGPTEAELVMSRSFKRLLHGHVGRLRRMAAPTPAISQVS